MEYARSKVSDARNCGGAALLVFLILSPTLLFPPARDQSVFAYVGSVIAGGGMPYRDAWEIKPPGIYLLYAALAGLAGGSGEALFLAVRIADVLLAGVTGMLLVLLARRLHRGAIGVPAAAWYAALYLESTYWSLAQAEAWANPLVLGAILLLLGSPRARYVQRSFFAGILVGAASLLKFTAVLPALGVVAVLVARNLRGRTGRQAVDLNSLTGLLLGFALPLAAGAVWLELGRALQPYLEIQRDFVAPYVRFSSPEPLEWARRLLGYTGTWIAAHGLPVVLMAPALAGKQGWRRDGRALAAVVCGAGLLAVWAQGKYFGYHWHTLLPGLALLSAAGGQRLLDRLRASARAQVVAVVLLAIGWSAAVSGPDYLSAAQRLADRMSEEGWLARFDPPPSGDYSFREDRLAADWLRTHTDPGERVFIWGFEPAVYLLADRRPNSRFFFNVPLTAPFAPSRWRQELLAAMRADPPAAVLVLRNDRIPWANGRTDDSAGQLDSWPELREWLTQNYRPVTQFGDFRMYLPGYR